MNGRFFSAAAFLRSGGMFFMVILLGACAAGTPRPADSPREGYSPPVGPESSASASSEAMEEISPLEELGLKEEQKKPAPTAEIYRGTGTFINPAGAPGRGAARVTAKGEYTLNFEATDLQAVVKAVLGDILKENYVLDPKVTGVVTVQTSRPLTKAELLPALENLLRLNGAALIREGNTYKVLPAAEAMGGPVSTGRRPPQAWGYGTRIVPLRHIAAKEMHKILEPFLPQDVPPIVDEQRNLLILTGSEPELQSLLDLVDTFDVDWLKGMSVGLFRFQHAEAKTAKDELENIFGAKDGPLSGLVRIVPVERLNALLVISQRSDYVDQARQWVERLDQVSETASPRLYVYRVQNAKAKDLATVLGGIFGIQPTAAEGGAPPAELAPGEVPTEITPGQLQPGEAQGGLSSSMSTESGLGGGLGEGGSLGGSYGGETGLPGGPEGGGVMVVAGKQLRIIADDTNNSLVILAKSEDFKMIEEALKKLDVVPLQVLIDASVIEVTLTDNLQYGVEWFFKHGEGDATGAAALNLGTAARAFFAPPGSFIPGGFSYAFQNQGDITVLLKALAANSKLNVLSSPSLMVLDNRKATIKVVDNVPVPTSVQTQPGATSAPIAGIEYKDAGVILNVTPRVNVGGRISLELEQDVTDPGRTTVEVTAGTNAPQFRQRNIKSTITVQSGETIVLGGLIKDTKEDRNTGVPFLKDIPLLGNLFRSNVDFDERTELIVLITPRAVRSQEESRAVTEEFRQRLKELERIAPGGYPSSRTDIGVKSYPIP